MNVSLQNKKRFLASLFALLLAMASLLDVQAQSNELTEIIIGAGNEESCEIPFNNCTSGCSYVECIFPAEAIGDPCMIYSISFYCAKTWLDNNNYTYSQNYYYLTFYMGTTSQTSYNSSTNWTTPDNYTKVFDRHEYGRFCGQIGWDSFVLDAPFYYNGGNLVIGVLINASGWSSFATPMTIAGTTSEGASITAREIYSLPSENTEGTIVDFCPNLKLGILGEALDASPASIEIGHRPNNCWVEPCNAFLVNKGIPGSVNAVNIGNPYFSLSALEIPHAYSESEAIPYNITTGIGEGTKTGNITFTYGNNKTLEVPLNATAYTPTTPDVWEMAREINTFPYSETITSEMTVYDNYRLPGSHSDGKDVVFKLDLNSDVILSASVTNGNNGKVSLYQEGFEGKGGPMTDNFHYYGYEHGPGLSGTGFEKGTLDVFNWTGNSTYPWVISTNNPYEGAYFIKATNQGIGYSSSSIAFTHYIPFNVTMSFWAKVSSENGCDKGFFFIDGTAQINGISGDGEWTYYSYEVPQGLHTFKWEYKKDGNTDSYEDCFYVDNVFFGDVFDEALNTINERLVFADTYYLVASSTSDDFTVSIDAEMMPLPVAAVSPMPTDHFNYYNDIPSSLSWHLGDYTKEYQVLFGETNPPTTVLVDWTEELAESCTIDGLSDDKTYYWRVKERNSSGTTEGTVWTFTTLKGIIVSSDNIIYVTSTGAGTKDGSSWTNAASSIQAAIDAAAAITENQPVVWVAKGDYFANGVYQTANDKTFCFLGYGGVKLYGGFNGDEPANYDLSQRDLENNATILDAESQCYVVGTQSSEWDGFVMQHGGEGGFYSYGETSTVRNCKILYSEGNGGFVGGGNLNCFNNEISYHSNAGIRKRNLYSALDLKDCVISHNTQYGVRGTCKVERCHVCNNGNGVSTDSSEGGVLINSVVANNDGFGTDFTFVFNSTIVNNGTGIARCYYYMDLYFFNNIIWGNERLWDANWSWDSFYSITMINNAIQGGAGDKGGVYPNIPLAGRGEVGISPGFVNPTSGIGSGYEGGDWSLLPTSPCVNFGYENFAFFPDQGSFFNNEMPFTQLQNYMDYDVVGNPRIQKDRIDIGAIESSYDKPEIILPVRPDANNIIYVKDDGDGDGSSWANAANLWDAIEISCLYESMPAIWVAQGTYVAPNMTFQVKENMRFYGSFEGTESANYDLTQRDFTNHASILDGNNMVRVLNQSDTLSIATAAMIDGFTLQNGKAKNGGGAHLLKNSSFSNCIVINNRTEDNSEGKGGGLYAEESMVINCSVKNNIGNQGGGLYVYKTTVKDCFVENNTANQGGGIYSTNSQIIQSHIGNNTATNQTGGVYADASDLLQCNIVSNTNGGLLVCADDNDSYANLYNSILWGNSGSNLIFHSGMAQNNTTVSHCAIEGWSELSNGNIPLSVDNEGDFGPHFTGDWQLGEASVCINAGNSSFPNEAMPLYDLNSAPRVQYDFVDIGAFESPFAAPCREMEVLEASIPQGETYDFYGTLLSQPGTYEYSWTEDGCLHLVMLHLHTTQTYYVSENGSGSMDGSSWANALDGNTQLSDGYTKLATLIASASPYSEFWLTSGHYYPCGDQDAQKYITMNEGVRLFGGFAGTENAIADRNPENDPTVFSGELQNDNIPDNNTECIFITSPETEVAWTIPAVLDGITISSGYASSHKGAALRVTPNTFASLNNCSIVENREGGIYSQGVLNISNSDLSNNNSELFGEYYQHAVSHIYYYNAGAICNMETGVVNVDNCTFYSNHSPHNGAICNDGTMSINASVFDNNTADCFGTIFSPGKIKVHNTTFNNNRSDHYIAVMWAWDSLELVNCNITNNYSNYYTATHFPTGGGANFASRRTSGIEAAGYSRVVNCSFINNDAGTCPGGALSITGTADVKNCVFRENTGQRPWRDPETGGNIGSVVWIGDPDGGALFVSGTATVSDCEFSDNTAFKGNTIGVFGGSLTMDRCKVVNNITVSSIGYGAIDAYGSGTELTINNSLIANSSNGAIIQGGGIHSYINNTTIVNTAGEAAFWFEYVQDNSIIEMNNCILSGYSSLQSYQLGNEGTLVMNNTLMHQSVSGGENDPLFVNPTDFLGYDENVDPLTYDWRLQAGSPCINAGDVTLVNFDPLATDLAGEPRVKNGQIDMGAYEYGTTYMFINSGNWSEASNWSGNAIPGISDEAFIKAACQLNEDVTISSLSVTDKQSITVQQGNTLTVTNTLTNTDASAVVIEDGAQLVYNNMIKATLKKDIAAHGGEGGWYFIASPVNTAVTSSTIGHFISPVTANYDLYSYDEPAMYWRNYKPGGHNQNPGFNIEPLKGYLYANAVATTLSIEGNMNAANATLSTGLSYQSTDLDLKGFNLVGNPFTHNLTSGDIQLGGIDLTTYYMVENGSEIVAKQLSTDPIRPGQGFLVQATADNQQLVFRPSSKGRGEKTAYIRISAVGESFTDMAYIQLRKGNTLQKMTLSGNRHKVFLQQTSRDYAAINIEATKGEIPVGFKAVQNGEYTLSVNTENLDLDYLHLIDNLIGADIDLLAEPNYAFEARTSDYASRFRLVFSACADADDDNEAPFAFISNGSIFINSEGTLQVIDVMGRVVVSCGGYTRCVHTTGIPAGVYVLRLVNGNEVRTQKIVID